GEDASVVAVKAQGVHEKSMAVERDELAAGRHLPEPDAAILTDRGESRSIRAEGDPINESPVSPQRLNGGAGIEVPELDRVVPAATGQAIATGMEGAVVDMLGMARQ